MASYFKELVTVYTTTRLVKIRSPFIAVVYAILVVLVWCSFLGSLNLDIRKIYQSSCPVHGVVLSKVKGYASTENITDEELDVESPSLYRRIWDPADIVYPAQGGEGETGSFTIVTNLIITPNQTLGICAETMSSASNCTKDSDCQQGYSSAATHGIFTGKCNKQSGTCGIRAWCPIEQARLPRKGKKPLLEDVKDFTVMLKNSVEFPECGNQQGRNLPNHMTESKQVDLKTCMYDKLTDPHCPIFRIGDIVKWAGDDFSRVAIKGGVFRIQVMWACDFDLGRSANDCLPKYQFIRVDDREAGESTGWNFRSADFYSEDRRTLKKQFALKILVNLEGEGRKFDFFQLVITLGATIGLFSVAPLACDFLLDVFNMISKSRACGKDFATFHDDTLSRYEEGPSKSATSSDHANNSGNNLQGINNKAMTSSTMSINNESFKNIPE